VTRSAACGRPRATRATRAATAGFGLLLAALPAAAAPSDAHLADGQLAVDKGCYNCHGTPPRGKAPTFPRLAADYARQRNDPAAQARLADRLRDGSIFGHVDAHERLTPEEARRLVRWLADGA